MSIYKTTKDGAFLLNGMVIPNSAENFDYRIMQEEVIAGDSTIEPYVQELEELRREKINDIKAYGLARIQAHVDAIDSIEMAKLIYKHMWPQPNPSVQLLAGEAVYDYAATKIQQAKNADRAQLEAYDPSTDVDWP